MKRILHITGGMDRAGAETMVMNLYRNIDKTKFQFDFVAFTDRVCDYDSEIEALGGRVFHITASNPVKRMKALESLLKQHPEWQTVHAHTLFSNAFHMYAAYKARVKQRIAHSHNTSDQSKSKWTSLVYQAFSRKMQARFATHFVACGKEAGAFLFPNQKEILFIPNAIDVEHFATIGESRKDYLRKEFNLPESTAVLLQLGRLSTVKNHVFSFQLLKRLKEQNFEFKFFIAGQGDLEKDLKEKTKAFNLEDEVVFLGIRSDVPELLAGSDVMFMPSLHEGFPVVLVESQACGTPALIADTIASEVDLGLNLVIFESLQSPIDNWIKKLLEIVKQTTESKEDRIQKLSAMGFDVKHNVKLLDKLYNA